MKPCSHKVKHSEVLGVALCVCCSHCQTENERLRKALRECIGKALLYTYAEGERYDVNQINRINGEIKHIAQKALVETNG